MQVPQHLTGDVHQKVTERVALLGSVDRENWSQFGLVDISINTRNLRSLSKNLYFQDTFHIAAGAQYQLMEQRMLSSGLPLTIRRRDSTRMVELPVGDQYRFGAGVQNAYSKKVTLGVCRGIDVRGEMPIHQSGGRFWAQLPASSPVLSSFFSLNMIDKFGPIKVGAPHGRPARN